MSNSVILTILGFLGIASLYMSMNQKNEKNNIKESYGGGGVGMPNGRWQLVTDQVAVPAKNMKDFQAGKTDQLNFQSIPAGQPRLGASPVVSKQSFVSYPNYQQSTPLKKPSLGLPAAIKYKPPTFNQMGVTEAYQCGSNPRPGVLKEGYTGDQMIERSSNPNPKTGCNAYAAGNYNDVLAQFANPMPDAAYKGETQLLNGDGELENYMIFDRYMTTGNARMNRASRSTGAVDFIRGDLPVCMDTSHPGWFNTSGTPMDLSSGALTAIAGPTQASNDLYSFMKMNGKISDISGGGVMSSTQQFAPQSMESYGGGFNGGTALTTFS
jgi:hypothetical protein